MKLPWWIKSWTVWTAFGTFVLCWIPNTRKIIHQAELGCFQYQAILHIVLRFKTENRRTKLSDICGREEG